jgi:hypothetical protein
MVILTMENFNSVFRDYFKEYALTCGRAGNIILTGDNEVMRVPRRDMRVMRVEVVDNVNREVEDLPNGARLFPDNDRGDRQYDRYEARYNELMDGKKKLIYKLLSSADPTVKSTLTTSPGYQALFDACDIHGLWHLTEQVCVGRGAVTTYALIAKLLNTRQKDSYHEYQKSFKTLVADVTNQGTAEQVLEKIYNALFVLGLDQEQFKEKLATIYGTRVWPGYVDLSAELHVYVESTQRMAELRKDNNEGKIVAHVAKERVPGRVYPLRCWNCGSTDHRKMTCDKPPTKCGKCNQLGHLDRFCRFGGQYGNVRQEDKSNKDTKITSKQPANQQRGRFGKKKMSNKANSKARILQTVLAHLISADDDDEEEDDEFEEEEFQEEVNDSNYVVDAAGEEDA